MKLTKYKLMKKKEIKLQEQTTEKNKLIAEFMQGFKNPLERWHAIMPNQKGYYTSSGLKYHESYDWLIPVVDKIESITGGAVRIENHWVTCSYFYDAKNSIIFSQGSNPSYTWEEKREPFDSTGGENYNISVAFPMRKNEDDRKWKIKTSFSKETHIILEKETKLESLYTVVLEFIKWYLKTVKK